MPNLPVNAALSSCRPTLVISRPQIGIVPLCRNLHLTPARDQEAPAARNSTQRTALRQQNFSAIRQLGEQASRERLGPSERSLVLDRDTGRRPLDLRSYAASPNPNIRTTQPSSQNQGPRRPYDGSAPYNVGEDREPRRGGFQRQSGFQGRGGFQGGQRSSATSGDRSRGGRGAGERRRGRGGREGGDRRARGGKVDRLAGGEEVDGPDDLDVMLKMNAEDLDAILQECNAAEQGGQILPPEPEHFAIADVSRAALTGQGPALALGPWGMSEVVEERLDKITGNGLIENARRLQELVRNLRNGEYIRFRSDAEKDATLALARTVSEMEADTATDETGEIVNPAKAGFTAVSEETREKLMRRLLEGGYKMGEGEEGFVRELLLKLRRNETIGTKQEGAMARKIRSLLPSQRVVRVPKKADAAAAA